MNDKAFNFEKEPEWEKLTPSVKKMVLGQLGDEADKRLRVDPRKLADLATRCPKLTHLYLWNLDGLDRLPELKSLQMECLDVRGCRDLTQLPELPATLETLDLGDCPQIESLPQQDFSQMTALTRIYLNGCTQLRSIEPLEAVLKRPALRELVLHGCARLESLEKSLMGEPGENVAEKVRSHLLAISEQGIAYLPECKLVVVGNGGVGKTSLVRALRGLNHRYNEKITHGISLRKWTADDFVPFKEAAKEILRVNIWDFGGQQIYHNTHRLFLESRAVFLVVWRQPRKDGKPFQGRSQTDTGRPLNYWLDQVYAGNPDPSVIIVRAGADEDAENPPENWKKNVRAEYADLPYFELSNIDALRQLNELKETLKTKFVRELCSAKATGMGRGRRAVREKIAQWQPVTPDEDAKPPVSEKPLLCVAEFHSMVADVYRDSLKNQAAEPSPEESANLLDYLHNAGALYCPKKWRSNSRMRNGFPIIIDQRWAIDAIYQSCLDSSSDGHRQLLSIQANGIVTAGDLEDLCWGRSDDYGPSYTAEAMWVFQEFMVSCGLLVPIPNRIGDDKPGQKYILPEFLPNWEKLKKNRMHDPLVQELLKSQSVRTACLRHRSLGPGFGSLLVGWLSGKFDRIPLYQYGGIGRVSLHRRNGNETESTVAIEWYREKEDAFLGDLVVKLAGNPNDDDAVLSQLISDFHGIPGFPTDAKFFWDHGTLVKRVERTHGLPPKIERERKSSGEDSSDVSIPEEAGFSYQSRIGVVGISVAGEDAAYASALENRLNAVAGRRFDVIFYRTDKTCATVTELIETIATADLPVALVSRSYLNSEYCMAELLAAARQAFKEGTPEFQDPFVVPKSWRHRVWILTFPDIDPLIDRAQKIGSAEPETDPECLEWSKDWVKKAAKYAYDLTVQSLGENQGAELGPLRYPYHDWMEFSKQGYQYPSHVLSSLVQIRSNVAFPTFVESATTEANKAAQSADHLAPTIREKVESILRQCTPEENRARLKKRCLQQYQRGERTAAAQLFEDWLRSLPDPSVALATATGFHPFDLDPELEFVRTYWRDKKMK